MTWWANLRERMKAIDRELSYKPQWRKHECWGCGKDMSYFHSPWATYEVCSHCEGCQGAFQRDMGADIEYGSHY